MGGEKGKTERKRERQREGEDLCSVYSQRKHWSPLTPSNILNLAPTPNIQNLPTPMLS